MAAIICRSTIHVLCPALRPCRPSFSVNFLLEITEMAPVASSKFANPEGRVDAVGQCREVRLQPPRQRDVVVVEDGDVLTTALGDATVTGCGNPRVSGGSSGPLVTKPSTTARVSSVEPSSTTMTSKSCTVWAAASAACRG